MPTINEFLKLFVQCSPGMGTLHQQPGQRGFTLIELSIVLVIIGLIVGGVLVGRDLIGAAGVRAQVSQIEKFNTAVNTFREKYDCLPGDCPNATSFGLGTVGGAGDNGNGNQIYESAWACGDSCLDGEAEIFNFFYHLSMAHMIPGSYSSWASGLGNANPAIYFPVSPIASNVYVFVQTSSTTAGAGYTGAEFGNNFIVGTLTPFSTWGFAASNSGQIPVKLAYQIDLKIDDGWPASGNVRGSYARQAMGPANVIDAPCTPNSGFAPFPYDVQSTSNPTCTLAFKFQ